MPKKVDRIMMPIIKEYKDMQTTQYGIYAYRKTDGTILYIGKDRHIDINRRHLDHLAPSKKDEQAVNQYLQKNLEKGFITYEVYALCADQDEMDNMEICLILFYKALGQCELNKSVDLTPELFDEFVKNISTVIGDDFKLTTR